MPPKTDFYASVIFLPVFEGGDKTNAFLFFNFAPEAWKPFFAGKQIRKNCSENRCQ